MTCVPSIRNLSTSRKKRMVLFHGGICVLCRRMYVLSLTWNFISCRNSECSPFLEWPFFFKADWIRARYFVKGFSPAPEIKYTFVKIVFPCFWPSASPLKKKGVLGGWRKLRVRERKTKSKTKSRENAGVEATADWPRRLKINSTWVLPRWKRSSICLWSA